MNTNYTAENNSWCQPNTGNRVENTSNHHDLPTVFLSHGSHMDQKKRYAK